MIVNVALWTIYCAVLYSFQANCVCLFCNVVTNMFLQYTCCIQFIFVCSLIIIDWIIKFSCQWRHDDWLYVNSAVDL